MCVGTGNNMNDRLSEDIVSLDVSAPIWERFFLLAPMVLIGTRHQFLLLPRLDIRNTPGL